MGYILIIPIRIVLQVQLWYQFLQVFRRTRFKNIQTQKTVYWLLLIWSKILYKYKLLQKGVSKSCMKNKALLLLESLKYYHQCSDCGLRVCVILTGRVNSEHRKLCFSKCWYPDTILHHVQIWWPQSQYREQLVSQEYHGNSVLTCDLMHVWYTDTIQEKRIAYVFSADTGGSGFLQNICITSQKTVIQNLKL